MFVRKVCAAYDHPKHNNTNNTTTTTNNNNNIRNNNNTNNNNNKNTTTTTTTKNNKNNNNNNCNRNWVLQVLWEGVIAQHIMKEVHDSLASLYLNSSIVCFLFLSGITTARRYYKDMSPLSAGDDNRYI